MPADAVVPAPIAHITVFAVIRLVLEPWSGYPSFLATTTASATPFLLEIVTNGLCVLAIGMMYQLMIVAIMPVSTSILLRSRL